MALHSVTEYIVYLQNWEMIFQTTSNGQTYFKILIIEAINLKKKNKMLF